MLYQEQEIAIIMGKIKDVLHIGLSLFEEKLHRNYDKSICVTHSTLKALLQGIYEVCLLFKTALHNTPLPTLCRLSMENRSAHYLSLIL